MISRNHKRQWPIQFSCWFLVFCVGLIHGRTFTTSSWLRSRIDIPVPATGIASPNRITTTTPTPKKLVTTASIPSRASFVAARFLEFTIASEGITLASQGLRVNPTTVVTLINIAVHLSWRCISNQAQPNILEFLFWPREKIRKRLARLKWMNCNFRMPNDKNELINKSPHTILLAGFSHSDFGHLCANTIGFHLFAPPVARILGTRTFSRFYISSLYASTFINLWIIQALPIKIKEDFLGIFKRKFGCVTRFWIWLLRVKPASLGASDAICAVHMFFCLAFPPPPLGIHDKMTMARTMTPSKQQKKAMIDNDIIHRKSACTNDEDIKNNDYPHWARRLVSFLLLVPDIFDRDRSSNEGIDRGAHLAGYTFGLFCYYCLQSPSVRQC